MLSIHEESGLLLEDEAVEHVPSPNHNNRPEGTLIDFIVIHNISLPPEEFGGPYIKAFFTNTLDFDSHPFFDTIRTLKVSSHCLIEREGKVIQFVPFHKRAWHAGDSEYQGRKDYNDFSIGIELEGMDDKPYTESQYHTLARLIRALQKQYPKISRDNIVGHNTIAIPKGRKTDPGDAFNWELLRKLI